MQKILIIDDDVLLLERIQTALRHNGFETLTANSGKTGVDLAHRHIPALIVSDVNMDEGDGYAALQEMRRNPVTAAIPFILMTGQADHQGMRRGMDLGADDYLAKPFTMEALLASVEARLRKMTSVTRSSDRKLDELRASISSIVPHELNTPLTAILAFTDILRTQLDSLAVKDVSKILQHIHDSGLRLRRLIENNILCSQLFVHAADPRGRETFVRGCTENGSDFITSTAQRFAAARQRTVEFNHDSAGEAVAVAPDYLAKTLEELLDNAFKFSEPESGVHLHTSVANGDFLIVIADKGRGMTPEQVTRIGPYMQFDRAIHEQQGVGLGLAVVAKIVDMHRGRLSICSPVGHGTTVKVSIPLYERPGQPSVPTCESLLP